MTTTTNTPSTFKLHGLRESKALALAQLRESKSNPRTTFDDDALRELADSIKSLGVLEPLLVRRLGDAEKFEIVAGARRLRAAKLAGLEFVPCQVLELSDLQVLEVQLVENLQRQDLAPLDEARGYDQLQRVHKLTLQQVADRVGKGKGYVAARCKLLALPGQAQDLLTDGSLLPSVALLAARIPDPKLALQCARELAGDQAGTDRQPMTAAQARDHVADRYMRDLRKAPFALADGKLLPAAGSCAACPKRSGNCRQEFADVGRADVCTDPTCFVAKVQAHRRQRAAEVQKGGGQVLTGKAAETARSWSARPSVVDLQTACVQVPGKTWAQALGRKAATSLPVVLVEPRSDDVDWLHRVRASDATAALQRLGVKATAAAGGAIDKNLQQLKKRHQARMAAAALAVPKLLAAAGHHTDRQLLVWLIDWLQRRRFKVEADTRALPPRWQHTDLRAHLVLLTAGRPSSVYADGYLAEWAAVCRRFGVKMAPLEKQAQKQAAAKLRPMGSETPLGKSLPRRKLAGTFTYRKDQRAKKGGRR